MDFCTEDSGAVLEAVGSGPEGLSGAEAAARLEKNGKNRLREAKKVSLAKRFLEQLRNPMIIILIFAAAVSGVIAFLNSEGCADAVIILAVVLLNAVLGVFQENKAEKAIEALQKMSAAESRVLRGGKAVRVKSEDLVVGDIVLLEAGDAVPADGRLTECASLKIEEAALTGESVPAVKQAGRLEASGGGQIPLGDRSNMAYMGSTVVYGRGRMAVTSAGMDTEMGKIADALAKAVEGKTPLQRKLGQLSRILTYIVVGICVFMFGFSLLTAGRSIDFPFILDTFMIAVSLAVAAIPEGLAAVVTVSLSIGVTKMSKRNAVIRKLTAVETLGCAEIICSDKTGTITQNRMTVVRCSAHDEKRLAAAMSLCSDAEPDGDGKAVGEPTECALVDYAASLGLDKKTLEENWPRIAEAPFDSMRKMMSTVHSHEGRIIQFTKGAPDELLKRCSMYFDGEKNIPMTDSLREAVLAENKAMADDALRELAAAERDWDEAPASSEPSYLERGLIYLGLVGMMDPVRPEAADAVRRCREAGLRPIMITGDHRDTAVAIARQLGMISSADESLTGAELSEMTDEELYENIGKYSVYARVQPEHKVRIVKAWQRYGKVTAMTGDGVNDAPSIKTADIGVGMGITGTDVTKSAADMVLADDNFATIVSAVEEGRRIYDNIRKAIQFLLASNFSEVLSIFTAALLGFTILRPVHLLWINLITDSFPALSLAMEKGDGDIMRRPPRDPKEGIFADGLGPEAAYQGVLVTVLTLAAYFIGHFMEFGEWNAANGPDSLHGMTMAFLTMNLSEILHSFNMRSRHGSIFAKKEQNPWLWGSFALSLALVCSVIYIRPAAEAFRLATDLGAGEFAVSAGLASLTIFVVEAVKFFQRIYYRKKGLAKRAA